MNRRSFIKNGSLALAAISGIPFGIKNNYQNQISTYKLVEEIDTASKLVVLIKLYNDGIIKSTNSSNTQLRTITVDFIRDDSKQRNRKQTVSSKYIINSVDKDNSKINTYVVTARLGSNENDQLGANIKILFVPNQSIKILNNDTFKNYNFKYQSANSQTKPATPNAPKKTTTDDEMGDCFLTSACVYHKGLNNDCEELQKLRWLRDSYMINTIKGQQLVKEYRREGPLMVSTIFECVNKTELLQYIHLNLVKPSIDLINNGYLQEAVDYYEAFVIGLRKQLSMVG